jgi:hypothetical protein
MLSRQSARSVVLLPAAPAVPLPHNALLFVDFETGQLELLDHPLRPQLAGVVGHMLLEQPAQQGTVAVDRKADVEQQQIAERAMDPDTAGWAAEDFMSALLTDLRAMVGGGAA